MPPAEYGEKWETVIETAEPSPDRPSVVEAGGKIVVPDRSLIVLGPDGLMTCAPARPVPTASRSGPTSPSTATAELADYLADLGVTHLYTAPLLTATPGSDARLRRGRPHPGQPGARRRGRAARRWSRRCARPGSAWSSTSCPTTPASPSPAANPAWWDVLKHGRESAYANWFDIDWSRGRLLLPVLADDAGRRSTSCAIEDGELRYYDKRFPIADGTGDGTPREVHDRQHYELVDWRRGDSRAQLPPVLRHRRPGRPAGRGPGGVRRHPRRDPALVRRGRRAGHPGRPPGRPARPGRLPAAAARRPRRTPGWWWRRSSSRARSCRDWPVAGTTGYDALAEVCGVFVDPAAEAVLRHPRPPPDRRRDVLAGPGRTTASSRWRPRCSPPSWPGWPGSCRRSTAAPRALAELAACFPVYRSYLPFGSRHLAEARSEAGRRRPQLIPALDRLTARLRDPADELAVRFQQFTGAVMAKGVEDTAFYRWTRFAALNEVGGDPARFGVPPEEFHEAAGRPAAALAGRR